MDGLLSWSTTKASLRWPFRFPCFCQLTNLFPAYNKWHETELERWLSDHSIPYPAASERKDLQNLVKDNWQSAVESPYAKWDANQLSSYIKSTGQEVKKGTEQNAEALADQVKSSWKDTAAQSHSTYGDLRDYVFDS